MLLYVLIYLTLQQLWKSLCGPLIHPPIHPTTHMALPTSIPWFMNIQFILTCFGAKSAVDVVRYLIGWYRALSADQWRSVIFFGVDRHRSMSDYIEWYRSTSADSGPHQRMSMDTVWSLAISMNVSHAPPISNLISRQQCWLISADIQCYQSQSVDIVISLDIGRHQSVSADMVGYSLILIDICWHRLMWGDIFRSQLHKWARTVNEF